MRRRGFDDVAEETCREFYAEKRGRPGIAPGVYFRMLMVGYLEGIGSERGIAWRCADSISLREFLGYGLAKNPPEHSSLSKTRKRLSLEAHEAVFARVLEVLQAWGLLSGRTLGVDATTGPATRSGWRGWRGRPGSRRRRGKTSRSWTGSVRKKGSNQEWAHPHDPEARITKMKDGRTRLAHKFEQAVDMETGAVVAATVQTMDGGDTASLPVTLDEAERQLAEVGVEPREVVADKGYHSEPDDDGAERPGAAELRERARPRPPEVEADRTARETVQRPGATE